MLFALSPTLILPALLRIGATDWHYRHIGNREVALIALAAWLSFTLDSPDITRVAGSCSVALALTLPGFFLGRLGGGDVKLLLALAPLWSALELLQVFVGGITWVVALLAAQHLCRPALAANTPIATATKPTLPLGTAMLLGTFQWFLQRWLCHG